MKLHYVYGIHAISHLLQQQPERLLQIRIAKERHDHRMQQLIMRIQQTGIALAFVPRTTLDRLVEQANHQGIVADCKPAKIYQEQELSFFITNSSRPLLFLILDGIQDPHNLGACFRSADAFGVSAIIAPKDKSVGMTATVSKTACGAAEIIPFFQVTNLARSITILKDNAVWIYGADGQARKNLFTVDLTGDIAIVLGAEGKGLRQLTKTNCDHLLKIPMYGCVESLNVSVAAGILLAEVMRQRLSIHT